MQAVSVRWASSPVARKLGSVTASRRPRLGICADGEKLTEGSTGIIRNEQGQRMDVSIKKFQVAMDLKNKGIELEIQRPNGAGHLGDLVVTKTRLIWCPGKTLPENGRRSAGRTSRTSWRIGGEPCDRGRPRNCGHGSGRVVRRPPRILHHGLLRVRRST